MSSENEKAERGVWKWKWASVTGREKKDPKKDDYISILSGNQVREADKKYTMKKMEEERSSKKRQLHFDHW